MKATFSLINSHRTSTYHSREARLHTKHNFTNYTYPLMTSHALVPGLCQQITSLTTLFEVTHPHSQELNALVKVNQSVLEPRISSSLVTNLGLWHYNFLHFSYFLLPIRVCDRVRLYMRIPVFLPTITFSTKLALKWLHT